MKKVGTGLVILILGMVFVLIIVSVDESTRECITCVLQIATVVAVAYALWDRWDRRNAP